MARKRPGPDEVLKLKVIDQLSGDSRVDASNITVQVQGGVVTLGGSVPGFRAREAAYEDASRVPGVVSVANKTFIEDPNVAAPSDEEVLSRVESALSWNPSFEPSNLEVSVESGRVLLEGSVDDYWKKVYAEDLATNIRGVTAIENRISVVPTRRQADEKIAEQIRAALDRDVPGDSGNIGVKVENGLVTLSGMVSSWAAKTDAFLSAVYTRGVVHVDDRMIVEQRPERT